jgi:HAD superfamily hydrolase (TIGR01509 family)
MFYMNEYSFCKYIPDSPLRTTHPAQSHPSLSAHSVTRNKGAIVVKAILCDIDGTLVDSNHLHARAWQDAFAAMDLNVSFEDALAQIGKGGDQLIPVFVPKWKVEAIEEPLEAYRKFVFQTDYLAQVKPFPNVRAFLLRLKEAGIRLSLASSASKEDLKTYKKIAHMDDLIEESSSADDAKRSKPHPDIFESTLKKLGLPADETIALGDTPYDAEAAAKCGLRTIGLTCGGWPADDLTKAGCVEVYRDVTDLLEHFDSSALMR